MWGVVELCVTEDKKDPERELCVAKDPHPAPPLRVLA